MSDTLVAQSVPHINPVNFNFTEGVMTGLVVSAEVNYGRVGLTEQLDVWGDLTETEKTKARAVYARLRQLIEAHYLGG